ncbi:hypothetical protein K1F50_15975 [Muricauda oceani]|uniref:Uncharacterized protein n=1 Tax=Flagellimonas oceani TaxID=2698672 RepID=A0A6G7IY12_9FLAO|nr:hypothetical protein [Allomuricauda oceani]MBW8244308.1 hypothetical protein [Allomuricauda oceani]QII43279.1 hypothetical protein GVT53_00750 [Allomuricauda oceani]
MKKQWHGDRTRFSKEDLRMFDDIANLELDYCKCGNRQSPEYFFCDNCEKPIPGVDEGIVKTLVTITGQFKFLKSK